jgi:monofunctional biosynthetic peptidoglycan transglycosylase
MAATVLFDFSQPAALADWQPINDSVMGGVSTSRFQTEHGVAVFAGMVSLANNGGFASVRSASGRYDLVASRGVALRVRGDGKTYKLNLRTAATFDGVSYQAVFTPAADEWQTVRLPFAGFAPTFRGRRVTAPLLDPGGIATVGLLIGDRQAGPFRLKIAWLGGYAE